MTKENGKPQIRFAKFKDTWEQRKLGECFSERVESMPDGELISVTINDGIKKFSELGRHDNSNDNKSKYKKVCVGDIAYNSMRMWQGASGYSPYEGIVSPAYTVLSPNAGVFSRCIAYQFKLPQMIHTFQINSQGITSDNWNLKYSTLGEIEIYISKSVAEQKQIAEFFTSLDHLITLHQRKYDKLTKVKKSMLEKMFPKNGANVPEIRFNGFTDAWEQRKFGELYERSSEKNDGSIGMDKNITVATMQFKDDVQVSSEEYLKTYYTFNKGDIAFEGHQSKEFKFGRFVENDIGDGIVSHIFAVFRPIAEYDLYFWKYAINNESLMQRILARSTKASTMMHDLVTDDFLKQEFCVPSVEEQKRIGEYLKSLDHLITLHQRKLKKLKILKKACLEKMFV